MTRPHVATVALAAKHSALVQCLPDRLGMLFAGAAVVVCGGLERRVLVMLVQAYRCRPRYAVRRLTGLEALVRHPVMCRPEEACARGVEATVVRHSTVGGSDCCRLYAR